ncbi:MAG: prolyl-tRNA synthetase associated domain-containing protein [Ruminiclostridium sp.]|nr:prolyl-tRNA synthetase associated domain-containing protein [Ruminiclostridium sp.]
MDKQALYTYLKEKGIPFEAVEHAPVFTVEEALALNLPRPEAGAKNLFLTDKKKRNYYLLTARDHLPVKLKDFQGAIGANGLKFASEEDLMAILGLIRGAVTPFGLLNDAEHRATLYLDDHFQDHEISVHPNDNTATVYLQGGQLADLLRENGCRVEFMDLEALGEEGTP